MFLLLLELFAYLVLLFCFCTQVFTPLLRGTPLFPYFKTEETIKNEIAGAKQRLEEARLITEKKKVEKEIEKEKEKN